MSARSHFSASWKALGTGLYYPSILGAGFFVITERIATVSLGDPRDSFSINLAPFLFTIVMVIYFSVSYLLSFKIDDDSYDKTFFTLDFIESLLVFGVLMALGGADASEKDFHVHLLYVCLFGIIFIQSLWGEHARCYLDEYKRKPSPWILRSVALLFAIGGFFFADPTGSGVLNSIEFIGFTVLTALYIRDVRDILRNKEHDGTPSQGG